MTAITARAVGTHVVLDLPAAVLDEALSRLAEDMNQSTAVDSALHELATALGWLSCPPHAGEPGVLAPQGYADRRDAALVTLRAVVEHVLIVLPPGSARDLGMDIVRAADQILARSTTDLIHAMGGNR